MKVIVAKNNAVNNVLVSANRYAENILLTKGKKTCSELGRVSGRSHDSVLRDLNLAANNQEEIKTALIEDVIELNRKKPGYLIVDFTLLVKEDAEKMEGVSVQHSGSKNLPGISATVVVWTNLEIVVPFSVLTWKKGDVSKVVTATDHVIKLAQTIGVIGTIKDGAFASIDALNKYKKAHIAAMMRFHSNRVVSVQGFDKPAQIKHHPAFRFRKNQRRIIKNITWQGIELCVIALKVTHERKGWMTLFLVTTMSLRQARQFYGLYKHRWKIETFFRECKQKLGLGDCQARTLKQQEAHCLGVFLAYKKLHNAAINRSILKIRVGKHHAYVDSDETLLAYA